MNNEYYGVASTPTEDFLAHYGVKGMKWGVRKAVSSGNDKALGRQYRKAAKKLAKLEKRAANGKKYAKRAAALGVGAAAAGGLAAAGTSGVSSAMRATGRLAGKGMKGLGTAMEAAGRGLIDSRKHGAIGNALRRGGHAVSKASEKVSGAVGGASHAVDEWGRSTSISRGVGKGIIDATGKSRNAVTSTVRSNAAKLHNSGISNNTVARVGAAALGAGLAGAAGYNAYRAATTKRAAKKAQQFRSEMNKAFAGTKYANGAPASTSKKKRKNRG